MEIINRRTFLKSLTAACGAAVVCPGELLKGKAEPGFYDFDPFGSEANRKKYCQNIFIKARQQGCTNSILYGIPYWCDIQQHFMSRASGFIITRSA